MNGFKAAFLTCGVTLLLAVLAFVFTFGALRQEVANLREDVKSLLFVAQTLQTQNTVLCERVAALEARLETLQISAGCEGG